MRSQIMYSHGVLPYSLYFPKCYTQITLMQQCILNQRKAVYTGKQLKTPIKKPTLLYTFQNMLPHKWNSALKETILMVVHLPTWNSSEKSV